MSGSPKTPEKAPRTMSSKLLTMKFMQRAAASAPISLPSHSDEPSPKRQKQGISSPVSVNVEALANQQAIQAALAAVEAKRQVALIRQAEDAGDTRWVLNFRSDVLKSNAHSKSALRIIQTGFAAIDHSLPGAAASTYDEDQIPVLTGMIGRRSFGKFNRAVEKLQDPNADESTDSSEGDEDDNDDESGEISREWQSVDPNSTDDLIKAAKYEAAKRYKAERKAKRKAEKGESVRLAVERKKKEVKLNQLSSISGSGTPRGFTQACHGCGKVGHKVADCPKRKRERGGEGDERARQSKKSR